MRWRAAFWCGTCLFPTAAAMAGPASVPASVPQSTEVMLYVSVPLGGGTTGFKLPNLSLRLGQARMGGNSGSPVAGDPMQHREFLRLEVAGRQREPTLDMRVELGARVTYDLKRGVFGLRADNWKRPSFTSATTPAAGLFASVFQKRLNPKLDAPMPARVSTSRAADTSIAAVPRR